MPFLANIKFSILGHGVSRVPDTDLRTFLDYGQYGCQIIGKVGSISGQNKIFDFRVLCAPGPDTDLLTFLVYRVSYCR